MSASNAQSPNEFSTLVVGGVAGPVPGGRHDKLANGLLANLHLSILDKLGLPIEKIGISVAPFAP